MKRILFWTLAATFPVLSHGASTEDPPFEELSGSKESSAGDVDMNDIEKEIDAELSKDQPPPKAKTQSASAKEAAPTFDEENQNATDSAGTDELSEENLELDKSLEEEFAGGEKVAKPTQEEQVEEDESGLLSEGLDAPIEESSGDGMTAVDALEAQLDNRNVFGTDGGDVQRDLLKMSPSEIFAKIPLRNPMSNQNWVKWAGPMIEKNYIVRKKDNLWMISSRLFGTPYLWPKIWHLNAGVTNPNIIEAKTVLSFSPGNAHSAPELAYSPDYKSDPLSLVLPALLSENQQPRTFLERVDYRLRTVLDAASPYFRDFLLEKKPRIYGVLPKRNMEGQMFYVKDSFFPTDLEDGVYNIVSLDEQVEDLFFSYRMRWRGVMRVEKREATITQNFYEIQEGHYIVQRDFKMSPLAIHEAVLGPVVGKRTKLIPVQESAGLLVATHQTFGVRFPYSDSGPRPGAVLTLDLGFHRTGKALLIDRDQRVGTLWLLSADREVTFDDKIL